MGSIKNILQPKNWKVLEVGKSKFCEDDIILEATIGYGNDYEGDFELTVLISKSIYEKIIKNELRVVNSLGSENYIKVYNKQNGEVSLIESIPLKSNFVQDIEEETCEL